MMKIDSTESLSRDWPAMQLPEKELFEKALSYSVEQIRRNLPDFMTAFLSPAGQNNNYYPVPNRSWTAGFWSGMIWLAYDVTHDDDLLKAGKLQTQSFRNRLQQNEDLEHHDIGFLYTPSCVADYCVTGDETARETAIQAAYKLMKRFRPQPGIFQRAGNMQDPADRYTGMFIIDCMLNIPLLFWAAGQTGDASLHRAACRHAQNSRDVLIQKDGAVMHTGRADPVTGQIVCEPHISQGKGGPDACWSRGQAWAVYGLALAYDYGKDAAMLDAGKRVVRYLLNRLPDDYIPNWDLYYTQNDVQRDTSAASIAVCGMLELAAHLPLYDPYRKPLEAAALKMLESLTTRYLTAPEDHSNALLKGGVYQFTAQKGVNEPCVWGDYFYLEALVRILRYFKRFW